MISIVIPIYNSEKYICKCLTSIKKQTFTDFEVLMMNDGSTDDTERICKEFAESDCRFKYFFHKNSGVSATRNAGIEKSKGEFIVFVDSDDYLAGDCLETMYNANSDGKFDIVQCGLTFIRGGKETEMVLDECEYSGTDFVEKVLNRDIHIFLIITSCSKMYCRQFLIESGVLFDTDISISEDCLFNTMLLPYINRIKSLQYSGYRYVQDNSTLSKTVMSYKKTAESIKVGNITSSIRASLIRDRNLGNNSKIMAGFQTAISIIYLSNAKLIENGNFTNSEKEQLYRMFFDVMDYPLNISSLNASFAEKMIIRACMEKNSRAVHSVYKLKNIKSRCGL